MVDLGVPVQEDRRGTVPAWSLRRVAALVRRYTYLLLSSWPRLAELAYWPTVQMVMWGFMTMFLEQNSSYISQAFGVLISGVLLWDILFRGQIGLAISFMEEMWSRNLGHLFVSPLRPLELVAALTTMSLIRTLIGILPAAGLAIAFFGFSIFDLGLSLVAFFFSLLIFAWAIGLAVSGLVLLWGQGANPWPGPRSSGSFRSARSTIRSPRCRTGYPGSPGPCRPPTVSRACGRSCRMASCGRT